MKASKFSDAQKAFILKQGAAIVAIRKPGLRRSDPPCRYDIGVGTKAHRRGETRGPLAAQVHGEP